MVLTHEAGVALTHWTGSGLQATDLPQISDLLSSPHIATTGLPLIFGTWQEGNLPMEMAAEGPYGGNASLASAVINHSGKSCTSSTDFVHD